MTTTTYNPTIDAWATSRLDAAAERIVEWAGRRPGAPDFTIETHFDGWLEIRPIESPRSVRIVIDDPEAQLRIITFDGHLIASEIKLTGTSPRLVAQIALATVKTHLLENL